MTSHILIVEDSPTQAEALRFCLEAAAFEVEVARDAAEALDRLRRSEPRLVVSDILMPGLSGYELCRRIKSDPRLGHLPVLLLTTLSDPLDIIQGLECGADNFVTKPYEPEHLVARIQTLLESKRLRSQGQLRPGVEVLFLGRRFSIPSDREQILDFLVATLDDVVRTNRELRASETALAQAKAQLEEYARRLEGQVRASEEKYRTLMERASDAILVLDSAATVLEANRQAEVLLGAPRAQIEGRPYRALQPDEELEVAEADWQTLLEEGSLRAPGRLFRRSDGNPVCADLTASRVEVDQGQVVLAILRDVTERNLLERQLRQAQKVEALGHLAGGVAHDFNNLLTAILGYSELLRMRLPQSDPARQEVEEIQRAGERGASLTRQLLAFSRKQALRPSLVSLNSVVADMEAMLRRLAGDDVELACALPEPLGHVKVDRGQIEQVLMNLVVNARDAMPRGGKLTIETAQVDLDEAYARGHAGIRPGPHVMLAVTDTGEGMSEETQARIFEPFYTTKGPGKGTGLGLATVHGIVKQSGGSIWLYSEPGQGATFRLYFPRAAGRAKVPVAAADRGSAPGGHETILVAEDDPGVRHLARTILEAKGYRVHTAADGEEALALCRRAGEPIHLLISDVVLPGIGGSELAAAAAALHEGLKLLFLSGYPRSAVIHQGRLAEGAAFLQKPFTPDDLLRHVRPILDADGSGRCGRGRQAGDPRRPPA